MQSVLTLIVLNLESYIRKFKLEKIKNKSKEIYNNNDIY